MSILPKETALRIAGGVVRFYAARGGGVRRRFYALDLLDKLQAKINALKAIAASAIVTADGCQWSVVRGPLSGGNRAISFATDNGQLTTDKKQKNPEALAGLRVLVISTN